MFFLSNNLLIFIFRFAYFFSFLVFILKVGETGKTLVWMLLFEPGVEVRATNCKDSECYCLNQELKSGQRIV